MAPPRASQDVSPLDEALTRVGDRWTLLVVAVLLEGPRRFNDLGEELPGIAPNILAERLRRLERQAVIVAHPYSKRPPRFLYELTPEGRELGGALRLLADWGASRSGEAEPPRHEACGTPVETRWWCPTCELTVEEGGPEEVHHV